MNRAFWYFLSLQLFKERSKHFSILLISIFLIFILSSVLFISSSIRFSIEQTLNSQPDFVISRLKGGINSTTPIEWSDELFDIYGVTKVTPRVYGRYFLDQRVNHF